MNRYEIRCTEAQTKKALELGAPIINIHTVRNDGITDNVKLVIPTAEQMIGWLDEQFGFIINIEFDSIGKYGYIVCDANKNVIRAILHSYGSRKEATLAAIDAALEYLTNKK